MTENLILIECKDAVGLVARISGILANHQLNITAMREFVDEQSEIFFTRIECQGNPPDVIELNNELTLNLPLDSIIRINPKQEKSLALLVTKEYHCLGDTLTRHFFNTLNATVSCVIGNYTILEDFTKKFDIPFYYVSHEGKSQEEFEYEILEILETYKPDYVVLAKFMRILSPIFVAAYAEKIINIHHSFLPAFVGANPYRQAHARGVKIIGATAHFVSNDLDEGPIITQQVIPVNHTFSAKDMVVAGKEIEKSVLSTALQLVLQDRVFVSGNRTILFE